MSNKPKFTLLGTKTRVAAKNEPNLPAPAQTPLHRGQVERTPATAGSGLAIGHDTPVDSAKNGKGRDMAPRGFTIASIVVAVAAFCNAQGSVVAPGAEAKKLAGDFRFTEGPASDTAGNVYFTDIPNNHILKWSLEGKLSTFRENSGGANGLYFDKEGNLLACEGGGRRLVSITPKGKVSVLAAEYEGKKFNSLNDLWIDPEGGVYFTDPRYGNRDGMQQNGEHVYYLTPCGREIRRVIDDMVRPNGVIGTANGKRLYVTDHGGGKTFVYNVNKNGSLSDKKLFCSEGSDGMTIDARGNVYLTTDVVAVYNRQGEKIEEIKIPERPANVTFGGPDNKTLFVTARTSLYSVDMQVKGARTRVSPELRSGRLPKR